MEEDYEYYLKEMAFLESERDWEEREMIQEMFQQPAKIVVLTKLPEYEDRDRIQQVGTTN